MKKLTNSQVRLSFDDHGCLTELSNIHCGHNYAGRRPVWRIYLQTDDAMDVEVDPAETVPLITQERDELTLHYATLVQKESQLKIAVTIRVRLEGDDIRWSLEIHNDEPDVVIRECQFPLLGNLQSKSTQEFIWSKWGGERIRDIRSHMEKDRLYFGCDHEFVDMSIAYPGSTAATNCFLFCDHREGLYIGCHDDSAEFTQHQLRLYGHPGIAWDKAALECGMVRYPHLKTADTTILQDFIISPFRGTWHTAASKYRSWANTWFRPPDQPQWIRRMKGWQRIILRHQYGETHYRYDQLPTIYHDGAQAGIDTFLMFGWNKGGHDNNYPDYTPDPVLGDESALREGIAKFRQAGGNVIPYSNGRLIDVSSDFYRKNGKRVSIKDQLGNEVRTFYRFKGLGTYAGNFANRTFVIACPSSPEWFDLLRGVADLAFEYGCQSVFYDQMGSGEYPCCDPSHGHTIPWMHTAEAKYDIMRRLREYVKQRDPNMGIGIELLTDRAAQHVDYVHSQWGSTGPTGFVEWFRYAFPEIILTDREIRDDTDVERRVNHCLLLGLRSDVEIYRCRRTIAETPNYAAYLNQANGLREAHADLLLAGRYCDTDGIVNGNPAVEARAFTNDNRMAVVVTQNTTEQQTTQLGLHGWHYQSHDHMGECALKILDDHTVKIDLSSHSLAVILYQKI